ncbi:hypothetical protein CL614_06585 [archaeon]|jgi:hypothetical protein|nr:hypothetical protein [archaeon]|tara:strand:+ start:65 stop:328 length:264 start_codon:yes stop_codon:yes gene_type:complete
MNILKKALQLNQMLFMSVMRYNITNPEEDTKEIDDDLGEVCSMIMTSIATSLGLNEEDVLKAIEDDRESFEDFQTKCNLNSDYTDIN